MERTDVSRGPAPLRAALLMTSCSASTRVPGFWGVSSEEEAAFHVQMQTAVCFLRSRVTHAGTRKLLLCLDSLFPNPNLGKAALSSLNIRLCLGSWHTRWVGGPMTSKDSRVQNKKKFRAGDHFLSLARLLWPSG